jgi:hypothetical protein
METKWRYRNAEPEITDKPVPKEYWELKKKDVAKALDMIGGKGFSTKKVDGNWMIAKMTGGKVEYDNPADYYNTCWKMAKKRALVDAVLTVTAASDIFTQDVEEMVENGTIEPKSETIPSKAPKEPPEPLLTFDSAMARMQEIKNVHELKAWWTKHFAEVRTFEADAQRELTAFKDHLKAGFENPPEKVGE